MFMLLWSRNYNWLEMGHPMGLSSTNSNCTLTCATFLCATSSSCFCSPETSLLTPVTILYLFLSPSTHSLCSLSGCSQQGWLPCLLSQDKSPCLCACCLQEPLMKDQLEKEKTNLGGGEGLEELDLGQLSLLRGPLLLLDLCWLCACGSSSSVGPCRARGGKGHGPFTELRWSLRLAGLG